MDLKILISSFFLFTLSINITTAQISTWDQSNAYTKGEIAIKGVKNYKALQDVPAGTAITSSAYWQDIEETAAEIAKNNEIPAGLDNVLSTTPDTQEVGNLKAPSTNQKKSLDLTAGTGGSVSGAGSYDINQSVSVSAIASDGYLFSNWSGDFSSTDSTISIVVRADFSLTASFVQDNGDTDNDSLTNYQEAVIYKTSSNNVDSDGDGINDGEEVNIGSNPAVSDTSLINYFTKQISTEKANSYNSGYIDGKVAGQMEVIDELIKIITAIASANGLNLLEELKTYSYTDFLTPVGTFNLASIQLAVEQFIDHSDMELSPYTDGWFFTPNLGWLWTSKDAYPYFFQTGSGWIYFKRGYTLPRFYNFTMKKWFSFNESTLQ